MPIRTPPLAPLDPAHAILDAELLRHHSLLSLFSLHLDLTLHLQSLFQAHISTLSNEESWDPVLTSQVRNYANDISLSFKALLRARFKEPKALEIIKDGLNAVLRHGLHGDEIPSALGDDRKILEPYATSKFPLFTFLPTERFQDRLERPIAVLTLRQISVDTAREVEAQKEAEAQAEAEVEARVSQSQAHETVQDREEEANLPSDVPGKPSKDAARSNTTGTASAAKEGLQEWAWWIAELTRRVSRDHYNCDSNADGSRRGEAGREECGDGDEWKECQGIRRYEGNGCVLLVDAKGAGIKDLELQLLPLLINIFHNHFPGLFESVFVVNYSWAHSGLWSCIKRVLPQAALDKIAFLRKAEIGQVFDLDRLPREYGGTVYYEIAKEPNTVLLRYSSRHQPSVSSATTPCQDDMYVESGTGISSKSSSASLSDFYTSARATPMRSRRASVAEDDLPERYKKNRKERSGFRMTRVNTMTSTVSSAATTPMRSVMNMSGVSDAIETTSDLAADEAGASALEGSTTSEPDFVDDEMSPAETEAPTALQKIKSLGNFRLYLSPSRRANIDLLLGSDDEDEENSGDEGHEDTSERIPTETVTSGSTSSPSSSPRRKRIPLVVEPPLAPRPSLTERDSKSYSTMLKEHHAKGLTQTLINQGHDDTPPPCGTLPIPEMDREEEAAAAAAATTHPSSPPHTVEPTADTSNAMHRRHRRIELPISAYDRMQNPMFGYPAVQTYSSSTGNPTLHPQHGKKRKRDLVKTLLFLFLLRLASLRTWVGQVFTDFLQGIISHALFFAPMHRLFGFKSMGENHRLVGDQSRQNHTPETAFALVNQHHRLRMDRNDPKTAGEWIWFLMVVLVMRGTLPRPVLGDWEIWKRLRGVLSRS